MKPFPVRQTVPQTFEELMSREFTADLSTPTNLRTTTEFDPETGCYIVRTRLGDRDIATPFMLCLLYTSPSPRDPKTSRMPSSA